MLKRKPIKQDNNVSESDTPAVFFERMEPKILLSADALSGLVASDPFNEDAANAGLDISASIDLLNTSYQVSDGDADISQTASDDDLSVQNSVLGLISESQEGDDTSLEALSSVLNDVDSGSATRQEIIFVDAATPDYQELLNGVDTDAADTDYQIFVLQADRDGVEQITEILGRFDTVDAVHLVGHGNEQGIQLGDSWLGQDSLSGYAESLSAWSNTLNAEADILIYGCNLAAADSGRQFINELANITEADVAASDDLTGNKLLGGDWDLEFTVGEVETQLAFSYQLQQQWDGTLVVLESFEPAAADMADDAYEVKSGDSYGQTFSYDSGAGWYVVNSIEVVLYKDPAASVQTITVSLRDSYDGTVLGSNTISSAALTTTEDWHSFDIGSVVLNDNTSYVIQIESDGPEKVYLGVDESSSYSNGDLLKVGGGAEPGKDAAFKIIHTGTGNYLDDFNTVSYNNSSGSLDWSPENWIEVGDDGNPVSGEIHVSGNALVLEHWGGLGNEIYRNVDLTGAAKATLEFDYTITGDNVNGGLVGVYAWDGFGDINVATYDLSASVGTTSASLDISTYANEFSAVTFRILAGGVGTNAVFTVDDVNIFASEGSNYAPVAANLDSTSNYNVGDAVVPITDITVSDADSGEIITATLTLADTSTGSLSANDGATYDSGTGVWTITDSVASINLALANLVFNPNTDNDIDAKIGVSIDDGDEDASGPLTGVINLIVTPVNDAPVATDDVYTTNEDTALTAVLGVDDLLQNDTDLDGDTLTVNTTPVVNVSNGSLTLNTDGTFTYTPNTNFNGSDAFAYEVSDGNGGTAQASVTITVTAVNDVPTTAPVTLTAIAEDSGPRLITQAELLANANDADGDALTATNLAISAGAGTLVDNGNGSWTYTPALNDDTSISFTYIVTDGSVTVAGSAVMDITPANDVPTTTPVTLTAIDEDSGARLITQAELLANANDVDGNPLTATGMSIASGSGTLVDNGNGTWSYTPTLNDDTAVSFSYTISDGALNTAATAALDIMPVNDTPTTTPVTLTAIGEDIGARLITQAELLANASDVDGNPLTATGLSIASGSGTLVNNGNGTWSYTPALNDDTAVSFSYTISDGSLTAAGSASLDITPVNDAPVAADTTINATEDTVFNGNLPVASDVEGEAITYALGSAASDGTAVVNANGSFSYTPNANYNGADSFSYTVSDPSGGSSTYTVTANVAAVNDVLVATDDVYTTNEDTALTAVLGVDDLLQNDSDLDGDTLTVNTTPVVNVSNGSLTLNTDGTFTYTPNTNFNGSDTFTYEVNDGNGGTAQASVTITVTAVNDVPVANNDAFTLNEGSTTNLNLAGNDTDIDGTVDPASIVITGAPTNGSVVIKGDGTVDYSHDGSETVADTFTYTILDNSGAVSNSGTVSITVTPVNDAPVANNDAFTVNEGSTTNLNLAGNDTDVDGTVDPASIVITGAPANGLIVVNADGSVDYTHDGSETLADSFSYTILDNSGTVSNTGTINLNVMPSAVMEVIVETETNEDSGGAGTSNTEDTSSNTEDTSSTGDEEKPDEVTVDEGTLNATDEVVFDTSTFTGGVGDRNVLTLPALYQDDNEQGERSTIIIRNNDSSYARKLDTTVIDRLRAQFTGYDGPLQLVTTDSFISKLDDAREEIVLENSSFDMVVGGSMSMSAGISVGYAIWLARSGVLMSGLLSSMPAWAFIDPLPVLASMGTKDDEEDEEDESLESMVEEKKEEKKDDK